MLVSSESRSGRQRLLTDPKTRELLRRLIMEGSPLAPHVGQDGLIHYIRAEEVIGDTRTTEVWIDEMLKDGILKRGANKELVTCPTHSRADPLILLECTKCKSRKMRKTTLVEHLFCGYIDADSKFDQGGFLVCPNCKRPIHRADELRSSGGWYECQNCLTKTSIPKVVFSCRDGDEFSTTDLRLAEVSSYTVEESVVAQLKNALILAPALVELLSSEGYAVSSPATLAGRSGTSHTVDVYGKKGPDKGVEVRDVAIQIAVDAAAVEPSAVISFFAKTFDLKPTLAILITIPSASEAAKQINAGYGITLVEDRDGSTAVQKVKALLDSTSVVRAQ
jgi:TackOD1 domain-containing protein